MRDNLNRVNQVTCPCGKNHPVPIPEVVPIDPETLIEREIYEVMIEDITKRPTKKKGGGSSKGRKRAKAGQTKSHSQLFEEMQAVSRDGIGPIEASKRAGERKRLTSITTDTWAHRYLRKKRMRRPR